MFPSLKFLNEKNYLIEFFSNLVSNLIFVHHLSRPQTPRVKRDCVRFVMLNVITTLFLHQEMIAVHLKSSFVLLFFLFFFLNELYSLCWNYVFSEVNIIWIRILLWRIKSHLSRHHNSRLDTMSEYWYSGDFYNYKSSKQWQHSTVWDTQKLEDTSYKFSNSVILLMWICSMSSIGISNRNTKIRRFLFWTELKVNG